MRSLGKRIIILSLILLFNFTTSANTNFLQNEQPDSLQNPWKKIVDRKNLEVSFLFYSKANNIRNGIVLKLNNKNDFPITYTFQLIFRSETKDHVEFLSGDLKALEKKAGSNDDLFFLPFKEGIEIAEVGIKNFKVIPFVQ